MLDAIMQNYERVSQNKIKAHLFVLCKENMQKPDIQTLIKFIIYYNTWTTYHPGPYQLKIVITCTCIKVEKSQRARWNTQLYQ